MNDLQWTRQGHDHGAALKRDLGYTAVYVHYNSGLHVAENGRALAGLLEELVAEWPVAVTDLTLLGHSMGGLVEPGSVPVGLRRGAPVIASLRRMVSLGHPTPTARPGARRQLD